RNSFSRPICSRPASRKPTRPSKRTDRAGFRNFLAIPVRSGLVFASTYSFTSSVGLIAYMMLLATLVHPAIAVTFALVFNASLFPQVWQWTEPTLRSAPHTTTLSVSSHIFHYLYLIFPIVHVSDDKISPIVGSLHVPPSSWRYPAYSAGYSLALSLFCDTAALLALERRKHI